MKIIDFKINSLLVMLCLAIGGNAQNKDGTYKKTTDIDSSYIYAEINYINDAVFMGRKDSVSAPYLFPLVTYRHKSGLYASGSLSYLTKSNESRIDLFLLTAGYDFTAKKLHGDVSITKYLFNDDSYNVISEVEADVTVLLTYNFSIINLGLASSVYFNSNGNADLFLTPELSYDFISNDKKFQISPTMGVYFGSQNFYEQYYINNRFGNGRGQGQGNASTVQETTSIEIRESEKFNLMAIEFSLPMWYSHNSLMLSFLPAYVMPSNPATLTVDDVVFEEDLENTFYWIVGIGYRF